MLILSDVKSSFVFYLTFTHNIISNKFSQHWRAAWNQSAGRMGGLDSTGLVESAFALSETLHTRSFSVAGPTTWNGIDLKHLLNGACSQYSPPSQHCSFPLGHVRERLWVGILNRRYINFDWLIDLLQTPDKKRCVFTLGIIRQEPYRVAPLRNN